MIARSAVTFAELRQLLVDLGFTVGKRGKFWFFEHTPSETWFTFRPYQARERVTLGDVNSTRFLLDWRGLTAPEAFDDRLKKATARSAGQDIFSERFARIDGRFASIRV